MKLKSIAPLLLSLLASPAFAHSYHDDDAPPPPLKQEVRMDDQAVAPKPKPAEKPNPKSKPGDEARATPAVPAAEAPAAPKKP